MENLCLLQQDYPALKIIKLEQNYRSSARILRVANQVIANNPKLFPKTLWSQYGEGEPVRIIACQNEQHEAEYAASNIIRRRNQSGDSLNYADFAILYRSNHQARLFEEALRSAHIPYRVSGGQSFFEKAEIKDILAYLRLLANPDDDPAFLRAATTPKRGIGDATLSSLNHYAAAASCSLYAAANTAEALAQLPAAGREALRQFTALMQSYQSRAQSEPAGSLIQELLVDIRYETYLLEHEEGKSGEIKWRNVQDLCAWLAKKGEQDGKTLIELSQTIALMNLLDSRSKEETDTVTLSTLHASKGLEYPHVILAGCEEGLFPHADSVEEGNLDEERRLMYVGITRAKHSLTLTHCVKRRRQGGWQFPEPSRFIDEMPQADLKILGRKGGEPIVSHEEGKANLRSMLDMLNAKMGQNK
ncbi:3'-5' exonuclease [Eikenella sp. NML97-A-109]